MVSWKRGLLAGLAVGLWGCGPVRWPVAWGTAPVTPLPHTHEEGLLFYGGGRIGLPTQDETADLESRFLAGGHLGLVGQWNLFRMDLTASGNYARYAFRRWVDTVQSVRVGVRATAFHLQGNFALAPKIGDHLRLESGLGIGIGNETWRKDTLLYIPGEIGEPGRPVVIPTFSAFLGLSGTLANGKTSLGWRWHFLGLGTGMTFAVRHGPVEAFVSTQLLPALSGMTNGTAGLMVLLPLK